MVDIPHIEDVSAMMKFAFSFTIKPLSFWMTDTL